jgi:hypothetical protein
MENQEQTFSIVHHDCNNLFIFKIIKHLNIMKVEDEKRISKDLLLIKLRISKDDPGEQKEATFPRESQVS